MAEILIAYQSSKTPQRHGVRARINTFYQPYPMHYHDFYEFEVLLNGGLEYEINGVCYKLLRGDIVAVSPGDIHRFSVDESTRVLRLSVLFKDAPSVLQRIISSVKFPMCVHLGDNDLNKIIKAFDDVTVSLNREGQFDRELIGAYTTIFITTALDAREESDTKNSSGYLHVVRAVRYIDENFASHITLKRISDAVGLEASYFSRIFKETKGKSFVEYLSEVRIEHARRLLASSDMSVSDVAFSSGFGSFPSFFRAFKKIVGIPPREFKKYTKSVD